LIHKMKIYLFFTYITSVRCYGKLSKYDLNKKKMTLINCLVVGTQAYGLIDFLI